MCHIFLMHCVLLCSLQHQNESSETFKLSDCLYDIDSINNDESLSRSINKLKQIKTGSLSRNNVKTIDYLIAELLSFKNLDNNSKQIRYKKIGSRFNKFELLNSRRRDGVPEEINFGELDKELKDLVDVLGSDSYWVYNFRVNIIISKIKRNILEGILIEINFLENFLEKKGIKNGLLGPATLCLYCLFYEKTGDWEKCEKYALEAAKTYPDGFNEKFLVTPVSFLMKSSLMQKKYDKFEDYKKLISYDYISNFNTSMSTPFFRINESLARYYLKNGKLISAISHQEIALAIQSGVFSKDSEQVKTVAVELRNMLKQNNEIQTMRNLEERYNLKPLP